MSSANDEVSLDGLGVAEAKQTITAWLEAEELGAATVTYKLRDWLFSRQRYWGEPFPIVYDEDDLPVAVPESMLPVELPEIIDFEPEIVADDVESVPRAAARARRGWATVDLDITLPDWAGGSSGPKTYRRELNTMPQWAGSCWYYLRYLDPTNENEFVSPAAEQYWMAPGPGGVDLYVGGVEHAVLHLLYARFWHKVLFDLGHVSTPEPFQRLFNQGYILADAYVDERGFYVEATEVVERDGRFFHGDVEVRREHGKMGKSLKNAVAPDDIYRDYGADTLRLYEMFMGPLDASRPWNTGDIIGVHRFLQRLWRNVIDEQTGESRVTAGAGRRRDPPPPAPHDRRGRRRHGRPLVQHRDRPPLRAEQPAHPGRRGDGRGAGGGRRAAGADDRAARAAHRRGALGAARPRSARSPTRTSRPPIPRGSPSTPSRSRSSSTARCAPGSPCPRDLDEAATEAAARADERVAALLDGKTVRKVIVVPGRLVNFVVG